MSSLDILRLEAIASSEGRKANIQGVLMDGGWEYWDSNANRPAAPKEFWPEVETVSDYW